MRHSREEIIERTIKEYELLDALVANLTEQQWKRLLPRPEGKDAWTVKDALAHITHWKADVIRAIKGLPRPVDERGLNEYNSNNLIFLRWCEHPAQEILTWHRQVQQDVLKALMEAPEEYFSHRERRPEWPFDLDGHSAYHRVKDIERALGK
jgi:uncharacterized damage-inducible protein DinB